jgi:hypothetical protein
VLVEMLTQHKLETMESPAELVHILLQVAVLVLELETEIQPRLEQLDSMVVLAVAVLLLLLVQLLAALAFQV